MTGGALGRLDVWTQVLKSLMVDVRSDHQIWLQFPHKYAIICITDLYEIRHIHIFHCQVKEILLKNIHVHFPINMIIFIR